MDYIVLNSNNEILRQGYVPDETGLRMQANEANGERAIALPQGALGYGTINIEPLKQIAKQAVINFRAQWLELPFEIDGIGTFTANDSSRASLSQYAVSAMIDENITISALGANEPLTKVSINTVYQAMMDRVSRANFHSSQLMADIDNYVDPIALLDLEIIFNPS